MIQHTSLPRALSRHPSRAEWRVLNFQGYILRLVGTAVSSFTPEKLVTSSLGENPRWKAADSSHPSTPVLPPPARPTLTTPLHLAQCHVPPSFSSPRPSPHASHPSSDSSPSSSSPLQPPCTLTFPTASRPTTTPRGTTPCSSPAPPLLHPGRFVGTFERWGANSKTSELASASNVN